MPPITGKTVCTTGKRKPFLLQVTACATTISKQTSAISSTCKLASTRTSNPLAKKEFLKAAKVVVDTTADLLKSIDVSWESFCGVRNKMTNLIEQYVTSVWLSV